MKDESILSDEQIKELESTAPTVPTVPATPAPSRPKTPLSSSPQATSTSKAVDSGSSNVPSGGSKVVNDVIVPATPPTPPTPPTPKTPKTPPVSASVATATTPADSTTVAGVTMSREDALKLALGDDAVAGIAEKTGSSRPTAVVMTIIGLVLVGAFLWRANASDLQVKLASLRAGLTASVPGFVPGGWGDAQSLKASDGNVSYELEKDGKILKIEQQKTDWDSQAVLEQFVLKKSTNYLALQSQGLTIYMFGDNQAVWVNQGTLYTLTGDHGIEQDDIIRMATSL